MNKRWIAILLCVVVLLPAGLMLGTGRPKETAQTYDLYFRVRDLRETNGGDALAAEPGSLPVDNVLPVQAAAEELVRQLLVGPAAEELVSPFPANTSMLSVDVSGTQARVDLTRAYGSLSGVDLTLADYCIAMTLTQLPEIRSVTVTVAGQELAYRSRQNFRSRDVLLSTTEDIVGTVEADLYFLNGQGRLRAESRVLDIYEGDTRAEAVVRALLAGPEDKELVSAIPEGFDVRSVRVTENECFVNLASSMLSALPADADLRLAIRALEESLLSLAPVHTVQLLVDGEPVDSPGGALPGWTFGK